MKEIYSQLPAFFAKREIIFPNKIVMAIYRYLFGINTTRLSFPLILPNFFLCCSLSFPIAQATQYQQLKK